MEDFGPFVLIPVAAKSESVPFDRDRIWALSDRNTPRTVAHLGASISIYLGCAWISVSQAFDRSGGRAARGHHSGERHQHRS